MKYCKYCGEKLNGDEKHCPNCGGTLVTEKSTLDEFDSLQNSTLEKFDNSYEEKKAENKFSENKTSDTIDASGNTEKPFLETDAFSTDNTKTLAYVGFGCSFFMPLIGLIISIIALTQLKSKNITDARGFAIAGIVISAITVGIVLIAFFVGVIGQLGQFAEFYNYVENSSSSGGGMIG